jgi:hypothetical protein
VKSPFSPERHPFCHGLLHDPGLKMCLYIKVATLPLQHLATFLSPIRRYRRRRVHLLLRRRHPPRPPHSAAAPVLCPTGFSADAGLPKSADALAPRHAAGPPLSAFSPSSCSTPSSPAPGAPPPSPCALPPGRLEHRRLVLLVGATPPRPPAVGVHRPCPTAPKLGLADASKLIVCVKIFLISFK